MVVVGQMDLCMPRARKMTLERWLWTFKYCGIIWHSFVAPFCHSECRLFPNFLLLSLVLSSRAMGGGKPPPKPPPDDSDQLSEAKTPWPVELPPGATPRLVAHEPQTAPPQR